jgi:hypothetical protein
MRDSRPFVTAVGSLWLLCTAPASHAALILGTGLGTTHAGNLVANGSFEVGAPANGSANVSFWANPANSPYAVPPGWTSGGANSSAAWGNDGAAPYRLKLSDVLPDGRVALDFHTASGVTVNQPPTFNADGTVSFPAPPAFASPAPPVVLNQVVNTQLTPAPSYAMSFWISGEENSTVQGNTGAGIIGMRLTNVLPGDPVQWLAVPNGIAYGLSKRYEYTFTPLNPLQPVQLSFVSWGGLDLSAYGLSPFGTQPILDDVIINARVPNPASLSLALLGGLAMVLAGRSRRRIVPRSSGRRDRAVARR